MCKTRKINFSLTPLDSLAPFFDTLLALGIDLISYIHHNAMAYWRLCFGYIDLTLQPIVVTCKAEKGLFTGGCPCGNHVVSCV